MRMKATVFLLGTLIGVLSRLSPLGWPPPVEAGCGCDKPPPEPAVVIPNVAFPGMTVQLFDFANR